MADSKKLEKSHRFLRIGWILPQVCQTLWSNSNVPLTKLLKKDGFSWNEEANKAFEKLKVAMCTTPVLSTPNFTKTFIVECDASGNGIGAVLMQEGRPLAFESCQLKERNLLKPIYEKRWWPYYMQVRNGIPT